MTDTKPERVTERQGDVLELIKDGGRLTSREKQLIARLKDRGLIEYTYNATNTVGSWELTEAGQKAWAASTDKVTSASVQHWIDTGRYLKRGETVGL